MTEIAGERKGPDERADILIGIAGRYSGQLLTGNLVLIYTGSAFREGNACSKAVSQRSLLNQRGRRHLFS